MPEQNCPNCGYDLAGSMFVKAIIAAERERCAKIVEPKREKPCDCIAEDENGLWLWTCNCHNDGDLSAATSWCEGMNYAAAIRNKD